MLKVKTKIKQSAVSGLGLFADQFIPKNTTIWEFNPKIDMSITKDLYEKLTNIEKGFFDHYGYWSDDINMYVCSGDNYRFTNHSTTPNVGTINAVENSEGQDIALRDIQVGEELFYDYRTFGENPED